MKNYSRFRFLHQPLTIFKDSDQIHRQDFPLPEKAKKRLFPIRALRYWWIHGAIHEECQRLGRGPVIIDLGCERGMLKRFVLPIAGAYWIGLDFSLDKEMLSLAHYDELHQCDFSDRLPINDSTADIVVCCMVLEHLPSPEFTISEITRILCPGGMALIDVPVAPKIIARIREWQFARQLSAGKRKKGHHIHSFWPQRLRTLAKDSGLQIEFISGTYLLRHKGSPLEDFELWIRINQVWGALFPSLSQELCIQLRKPLLWETI